VLDLPRRGCLNIHASLLPRWRGAAPIQRALLAGDARPGVCIMQMEEGLDTGPVLLERSWRSARAIHSGTLTESLARLGAEAITEALLRLDEIEPRPQDSQRATYAAKFGKDEARDRLGLDAAQIDRQVRAFNPAPGRRRRSRACESRSGTPRSCGTRIGLPDP
jgi:methionyl-tRNA formyltransferase